jgi:hypothetical protein
MKSFNNHFSNHQGQLQQRRPYNNFSSKIETSLLPNEVRISSQGNFGTYVRNILTIMESGYKNCKVVGRGTASQYSWDIYQYLLKKAPQYSYQYHKTTALNK